jgi:hypothetical protein
MWPSVLIGEAGEFVAPIQSFHRFFYVHYASPIGGARIAGPIVLTLQKDNERIGEARKTIRSASPIVIEIA